MLTPAYAAVTGLLRSATSAVRRFVKRSGTANPHRRARRQKQKPPFPRKVLIEMLEQRLLLSATPSFAVSAGGTLDAQFTDAGDQVSFTQLAGGDTTAGFNIKVTLAGSADRTFSGVK